MPKRLCKAGLAALLALSALSCSHLESNQGSAAVGASDAAAAEAEGRCRNTPLGAAKHYCERMGYRH
jgi:hypothetical protein